MIPLTPSWLVNPLDKVKQPPSTRIAAKITYVLYFNLLIQLARLKVTLKTPSLFLGFFYSSSFAMIFSVKQLGVDEIQYKGER